jgi:two-component sensor histidine kinase
MALVINELVSNAGKYAYPSGGAIWVRVTQSDKTAFLYRFATTASGCRPVSIRRPASAWQ